MLKIIESMTEREVEKLLYVYSESNLEIMEDNYLRKHHSRDEAMNALVKDYKEFLSDFIIQDNQLICVWEESSCYTTGLRLIDVGNGIWFIEALETAPNDRNNGYAKLLITDVIAYVQNCNAQELACLINRNNKVSQVTHKSCGFIQTNLPPINWDKEIDKHSIKFVYKFNV